MINKFITVSQNVSLWSYTLCKESLINLAIIQIFTFASICKAGRCGWDSLIHSFRNMKFTNMMQPHFCVVLYVSMQITSIFISDLISDFLISCSTIIVTTCSITCSSYIPIALFLIAWLPYTALSFIHLITHL